MCTINGHVCWYLCASYNLLQKHVHDNIPQYFRTKQLYWNVHTVTTGYCSFLSRWSITNAGGGTYSTCYSITILIFTGKSSCDMTWGCNIALVGNSRWCFTLILQINLVGCVVWHACTFFIQYISWNRLSAIATYFLLKPKFS